MDEQLGTRIQLSHPIEHSTCGLRPVQSQTRSAFADSGWARGLRKNEEKAITALVAQLDRAPDHELGVPIVL